ncbi:transcription factor, DNA binding domain cpaE [Curvularia clavata]|uniref:Transcription factor, DNA binding domain cpaE n=1 Tax=Curvularia clavata TaxID=95742 RepID=A0A9Q8Z908_CURCL|nr:transcription factor, DNA binding domain cpaE [Curvularia clavata]
MAERVPVLWCAKCNKPFTKHSALKRHGYYCRSNTRPSVPRRRSCAACAKAKTGCDNALPACSRCAQKGFTCHYPSKSAARRPDAVDTRRPVSTDPHNLHHNRTSTIVPEQTHDLEQMTPVSNSPMLFTDMEWNFDDITALADFMHPTPQSIFPSITASSSPAKLPDTIDPQSQHAHPSRQNSPRRQPLNLSISPVPSPNVRSMIQRPKIHPGADRTASLIFFTLKSYPLMLRQNTLPPFIHPSCVSFTDGGGAQGSRRLFWRNVQQECERICDQSQSLNKWDLLSAMQALSIYVLIRLDEGETEHNNFDHLLERAVILTAMQISYDDFECRTHHVSCSNKSGSSWQDWVYKESRRRLAVIYRILNKLVFFSPAAMCDMPAEFVIAPLPAKRQLWEAKNAEDWKMQSQKEVREQVSYALAVDGKVVKLNQRRLSCRDAWLPYTSFNEDTASQDHEKMTNSTATWWAEWCSGMDSMGALIMLAASMA